MTATDRTPYARRRRRRPARARRTCTGGGPRARRQPGRSGHQHGRGLSVSARLGEVETVEYQRDRGMGVTVYFGTRKGTRQHRRPEPGRAARDRRQGVHDREIHGRGSLRGLARCRGPRDRDPGPRSVASLGCHARAGLRNGDRVRGRRDGGRSAHHEFRRRRRQHASRHSRVWQLAGLSRGVSRHGAQHQLLGARRRRRADGARLLVQHDARLARARRCRERRPPQWRARRAPTRRAQAADDEGARALQPGRRARLDQPLHRRDSRRQPISTRVVPARRGGRAGVPGLVRVVGATAPAQGARRARRSITKASPRAIANSSRPASCSATC